MKHGDGKIYLVDYFNLDVIISAGYRIKSHRGPQFRIRATQRLRESIVKPMEPVAPDSFTEFLTLAPAMT